MRLEANEGMNETFNERYSYINVFARNCYCVVIKHPTGLC